MYNINITDSCGKCIELQSKQGESLFLALSRHQPPIFQGNCGGMGRCNACRVFVAELQTYVKACELSVTQDLHVTLPFAIGENVQPSKLCAHVDKHHTFGVAIDIGTTSIGMRLIDIETSDVVCEHSMYNPQAVYGADVISRIAAVYHNLKLPLWEQLIDGSRKMADVTGLALDSLRRMTVAANTTMIYLFMGYPPKELGTYPFHAAFLDAIHGTLESLLPDIAAYFKASWLSRLTLDIYPGCSAFVGADIIAGAVALSLGKKEKYDLLIDLGTNGEILLVNANQGFCGATSCGSAFDGYVTSTAYSTDILTRITLLRTRGLLHKDGSLMERYRQTGYTFADGVTIHQEDIRNIQKAKAAIRTGIDILLQTAGVSFLDCQIYVAGNFGFHLERSAAMAIGMFPDDSLCQNPNHIVIAGNSALNGAQYLLLHPKEALLDAKALTGRCRVLEFANHKSFSKKYIDALDF